MSSDGARRYGGRWNHAGTAVVYTSESLSLAALEYLVNLPMSDLPDDLISVQLQIPDDPPLTEISIDDLPDNWRAFPAIEELKDIGTDWVREAKTAVLSVPSVVIPTELNYLINPGHEVTRRIEIVSVEPFALDVRLYRSQKPTRKGSRKSKP
ncbi:MAG TPA: RES family NAD+ phosphorylase [Pyrinomonadaceae bacterium]|nr:RES family NAD+ phosphorylase [Pyrinomonadaceae bacterium]